VRNHAGTLGVQFAAGAESRATTTESARIRIATRSSTFT
jgi:hypothetical protein